MIGLGVGIDYALFIVTRHREELDHGNTPLAAVGRATATAGASVTYAGVTVVVAIAGLATAGVPLITSLGLASMLVVVVAMLAALTLVPALLAVAGRRIDALRLPLLRRHPPLDPDLVEGPVPHAQRWASHIERHPLLYTLASGILLLVFAAPASVLRLGEPDDGVLPAHTELRRAYQTIATHYGVGRNAPLSVVVAAPPGGRLDAERLDRTLQPALRAVTDVASAGPAVVSPGGSTAVLTVVPASAPQDARTTALVGRLRDRLHRLAGRLPDRLLVTGGPAGTVDFTNRLTARLPLFVGVVLAVSFLLLMLVFRSLLVPLKAVVLDLLSILAAYGVVVAGFQWGWLTGVFGLSGSMPVVEVVPMMMFAIVFGLSMDYEVFLLSRVRERWRVTGDNARSVVSGLASTARVISSAAAIMVCVFLAFTFSAAAVVTMMGLGLAAAVLIDATIVRLVLVPGMMVLFDRGNWWLPRWLDRILPHVHIED
jgi:RND superfamily putative drug exporter